jgi:hypothetical protein
VDVDLAHIADVRDDRQPARVGGMGDLDIFGEATARTEARPGVPL